MKYKPNIKSFDHQRKGLVWLWQKTKEDNLDTGSKGGGLFWDPGTGKTKGAYDFLSALVLDGRAKRVLVLCPINALGVWDEQADTHIHSSVDFQVFVPDGSIAEKTKITRGLAVYLSLQETEPLTILVHNYAAIIKRDSKWDIMKALEEYNPDLVILDESHHIKNPTSKQAKAAHRISGLARYVLIMTGTPIGKNYLDLYGQLKAVDPNIWKAEWARTGKMNWTEFKGRYAIWGGKTGYEIRGYINLQDLEDRYRPHIRSARKEDIKDMPKVTDSIVPVELNATARRVYDIFKEEGLIVHKRHLIEAPIPLTKLLRLQQMTGGWVHDEHGEMVELHREKLSVLSDLLADLASAGKSVLVFARFIAEMDAIRGEAVRHFDWVGSIRGGVSSKDRKHYVAQFQRRSPSCMVIQSAAAEAIDGLQNTCSYGVFYSSDYSLIHWNQARGRIDRTGQKEPVTFYHLQVNHSVDSLILQALKTKKDIERIVMNNPEVLLSR